MIVLIVVDAKKRLIHIFVGMLGSINDSRVLCHFHREKHCLAYRKRSVINIKVS